HDSHVFVEVEQFFHRRYVFRVEAGSCGIVWISSPAILNTISGRVKRANVSVLVLSRSESVLVINPRAWLSVIRGLGSRMFAK
ncbi:hypothetical protein OAM37_03315, partial [bacterium]|nr:hypothetical protein [bacterium]